MKRIILLILVCGSLVAQKKRDVAYYKDFASGETPEIKVITDNSVAKGDYFKTRVRVENKTKDFIVLQSENNTFTFPFAEVPARTRFAFFPLAQVVIPPYKKTSFVAECKDDERFKFYDSVRFNLNGVFRLSETKIAITVEPIKIPAAQNEFISGPFKIVLEKTILKDDLVKLHFKLTYLGSNMGSFQENKMAIRMPDKNEYASIKANTEPILIAKGEDYHFSVEFSPAIKSGNPRFAEMEVLFRDALNEVTLEKLDGCQLMMQLNRVKTP